MAASALRAAPQRPPGTREGKSSKPSPNPEQDWQDEVRYLIQLLDSEPDAMLLLLRFELKPFYF